MNFFSRFKIDGKQSVANVRQWAFVVTVFKNRAQCVPRSSTHLPTKRTCTYRPGSVKKRESESNLLPRSLVSLNVPACTGYTAIGTRFVILHFFLCLNNEHFPLPISVVLIYNSATPRVAVGFKREHRNAWTSQPIRLPMS